MRASGIIIMAVVVGIIGIFFYYSANGMFEFHEPKTIKVCSKMGTEQYIQRAPSVGLPLFGDGDSLSVHLPLGDDVIKEREKCLEYTEVPNPKYVEIEN